MSDYIKRQDVIDIIHKEIESTKTYIEHNTQINIKFAVEGLPTISETEIIRKAFERVVERLKKKIQASDTKFDNIIEMNAYDDGVDDAIEIVKEEGGIE